MVNCFDDIIKIFEDGNNLEKDQSLFTKTNYSLDRIKKFIDFIGNPEKNLKIIHVAGSKGKGTVTHILATLIENSNHKCAIFTSPHVYDYRERFSLPNSFFKDEEYIKAGVELKKFINLFSQNHSERLTTFEKYFAFALLLFKSTNCEYAILETGLGGRLDATNAVNSFAEILTTIEKEHTAILGKTLKKIAIEKSKIIKPHSVVFALDNKKNVNKIFENEAKNTNSKIYFLSQITKNIKHKICTLKGNSDFYEKISFCDLDNNKYSYSIPLLGSCFVKDSIIAIMCAKSLGLLDASYPVCLKNISIPSRFEIKYLDKLPLVLDGAHTELSIKNTLKTFNKIYKQDTTLVFGCAIDKNVISIAKTLAPSFKNIIIQKPGDFKKSDIDKIYDVFQDIKKQNNLNFNIYKNIDFSETMSMIKKLSLPALVTGSFYLADEINKRL